MDGQVYEQEIILMPCDKQETVIAAYHTENNNEKVAHLSTALHKIELT